MIILDAFKCSKRYELCIFHPIEKWNYWCFHLKVSSVNHIFFLLAPQFLNTNFRLVRKYFFVLRTIWIRNVYRKSMKYKEQKLWFNYFPFPLPPLYKTNIYSEWKNVFNILKIHILKTKLKLKRKEFSNLIKNKRQKMYKNIKMLLEKVIIII